jgi:hypothetical protein
MKSTLHFVIITFGLASSVLGQPSSSQTAEPAKAQFSPDGNRLVTTGADQRVRIWDAKTGQPVDAASARTAKEVLAEAKARAASGQKAIFVHFGASWCGWCHKLDAFLDNPDVKPVFEKYFVPVKLVVQERDRDKALENPGADALLASWGGPDGLPYYVFLDPHGKLLSNSKSNGHNVGYPAQPAEIDSFMQMVAKAAPTISPQDSQLIKDTLVKAQPAAR